MPRWDDVDDEEWDEDDGDENDAEYDTVPCPYCRRQIHEDTERCPYCGSYLSDLDAPLRKPWWLWLGVAACLFVVYRWIVWV